MNKKIIAMAAPALLLLLCFTGPSTATGISTNGVEGDFRFIPIRGGNRVAMITEYIGKEREVVIPSQLQGLRVTVIGSRAFANKRLTGVIIPNTVVRIESEAFAENQLTNVIIPNSVWDIRPDAFAGNQLAFLSVAAYPKNGGTITPYTPSGRPGYPVNTQIAITATAAEGFRFVGWDGRPGLEIANPDSASTIVTLSMDGGVSANFRPIPPTPGSRFNPSISYSSLTDPRDGQTYRTVRIGGKTWMAENLNYTTNNSRCYEDEDSNCEIYGRLYTLDAAQRACPAGWTLPEREDWLNLIQAVGGRWDERDYSYSVAGGKLKSKIGWGTGGGTDVFGFSALPGGSRGWWEESGNFNGIGSRGNWWGGGTGYIISDNENVRYPDFSDGQDKRHFPYSSLSVRCVQK
ncbi:MAG: leucine-rich repeat protein [Chitinispirillales bacterium]|jgi:uncharacterized protein (TIGR02145 family)|nr:leucine-rich repeat protein [Chitinispirillales bacterium]